MNQLRIVLPALIATVCILNGCASTSSEDAGTESGQRVITDEEARRQKICDELEDELRSVAGTRPTGPFPYPSRGNREYTEEPNTTQLEADRITAMQRRYRCHTT